MVIISLFIGLLTGYEIANAEIPVDSFELAKQKIENKNLVLTKKLPIFEAPQKEQIKIIPGKSKDEADREKEQATLEAEAIAKSLERLTDEQFTSLIDKYFPLPARLAGFRLVKECENKELRPNIVSSTEDWGLWQINFQAQGSRVNWDANQLLDPEISTRVASEIWREDNNSFGLWSCSNKLGIR